MTKALTVVLILLALAALYALFHFATRPSKSKEEEPIDYQPTPFNKSISDGLNPANVYSISKLVRKHATDGSEVLGEIRVPHRDEPIFKPQGSRAKLNVVDDRPSLGYLLVEIDKIGQPDKTANVTPRACTLDEEMYNFITKNPPAFTGVAYPKPIFLSYYCDKELSSPPWLRYRDSKGHYIKKELATTLFNLRTALKPYVQFQEQAFMVDYKIYRVSDRQ